MIRSRTIGQVIAATTISWSVLVFLGWLFHAEMDHTSRRLEISLLHSHQVVNACKAAVEPDARDAVLVYLAIEDYFRPAEVRLLEFWLASMSRHLGLSLVGTLGIGQISKETFVSARDVASSDRDSTRDWIASLSKDCENIDILQAYAKKKQIACNDRGIRCALYLACFWHTGRQDSCLHRLEDRGYAENVVLSYSKIVRADQITVR